MRHGARQQPRRFGATGLCVRRRKRRRPSDRRGPQIRCPGGARAHLPPERRPSDAPERGARTHRSSVAQAVSGHCALSTGACSPPERRPDGAAREALEQSHMHGVDLWSKHRPRVMHPTPAPGAMRVHVLEQASKVNRRRPGRGRLDAGHQACAVDQVVEGHQVCTFHQVGAGHRCTPSGRRGASCQRRPSEYVWAVSSAQAIEYPVDVRSMQATRSVMTIRSAQAIESPHSIRSARAARQAQAIGSAEAIKPAQAFRSAQKMTSAPATGPVQTMRARRPSDQRKPSGRPVEAATAAHVIRSSQVARSRHDVSAGSQICAGRQAGPTVCSVESVRSAHACGLAQAARSTRRP